MIVACPACQARFQYDDSRFGAARTKRFKCPKCGHLFEVANPVVALVPGSEAAAQVRVPDLPAAPLPHPPLTMPEETEPTPPGPLPGARTTARRDRASLLVAAGLQAPGMPTGFRFSLAFLTGPQASTVQVLNQPLVVIGREEGDVITQDPETSRRHAILEIRGDGTVWITDQQSTNGTKVGGERIEDTVQIHSQQEFTCGNSTFMLLVRDINEFPLN